MKLTLPIPPSINHYYQRCKNGKLRIGDRGKEYRLATVLAKKMNGLKKLEGAIEMTVHIICPDYRKRDVDNILKCLLDSITKANLIDDDSMIVDLSIVKHKPDSQDKDGKLIVFITGAPVSSVEVRDAGAWLV